MMKRRFNQSGFGAVEVILLIVVLGLIASAVWLFFQARADESNDTSETATEETWEVENEEDLESIEAEIEEIDFDEELDTSGLDEAIVE